jgi:hypothetical protein
VVLEAGDTSEKEASGRPCRSRFDLVRRRTGVTMAMSLLSDFLAPLSATFSAPFKRPIALLTSPRIGLRGAQSFDSDSEHSDVQENSTIDFPLADVSDDPTVSMLPPILESSFRRTNRGITWRGEVMFLLRSAYMAILMCRFLLTSASSLCGLRVLT